MYVDRRARYAGSAALAFSASLPLQGPWLTSELHYSPYRASFSTFYLHGRHFVCASLTTGSVSNVKNVQKV